MARRSKKPTIDPAHETPATATARKHLAASIQKVFDRQFTRLKEILKERWPIKKAGESDDEFESILQEVTSAISVYFQQLPVEATESLDDAIKAGVSKGIAELGITDAQLINKVNRIARDWANSRAAEMVGMRYAADGGLVVNPNAKWVIGETTRLRLRNIIRETFTDNTPLDDVITRVQQAGLFEGWRAEMIARTEVAHAQAHGNLEVWKNTGAVETSQWFLSEDHDDSLGCECEDNDGEIVKVGESFPSGDDCPPAHPNCWCVIIAAEIAGEGDDETGETEEAESDEAETTETADV